MITKKAWPKNLEGAPRAPRDTLLGASGGGVLRNYPIREIPLRLPNPNGGWIGDGIRSYNDIVVDNFLNVAHMLVSVGYSSSSPEDEKPVRKKHALEFLRNTKMAKASETRYASPSETSGTS